MSTATEAVTPPPVEQAPLWQIWRNPIFIRYCRARLRPVSFAAWASIVMVLTGFLFFMSFLAPQKWGNASIEEAAGFAFVTIIVIQCALLMFKGSFNMAAGITREGVEGILDYQRLSPMSPASKALGYLFGLPVQEWALFALTFPFLGYIIYAGDIPLFNIGKVYAVMIPAVLLYHMTGFLAGMVVKQRFLAGFLSQILMVLLYFILPQLSNIGYVFFEYLTIRPVLFDELAGIVPKWELQEPVPFYTLQVPVWLFSIAMQLALFSVFLLIVLRKWKNENAHLLGKHASVGIFAGMLSVFLGTILPLIPNGKIFPPFMRDNFNSTDENLADAVVKVRDMIEPQTLTMPGVFGLFVLILICLMICLITPSRDSRLKELRRIRKLGWSRIPAGSDAASSLPQTLAFCLLGSIAWMVFLLSLFNCAWFQGMAMDFNMTGWILCPLTIFLPAILFQQLLEQGGFKAVFIPTLYGWIVPLLTAIIILSVADGFILRRLGYHLMALSGPALPFYAFTANMEGTVSIYTFFMRSAFTIAIVLYLCVLPLVLQQWLRYHRTLKDMTHND
ncbi:MAG: hypothetical protein ACPGJU_05680 [Coraliomargarita sp.]